MLLTLASPPQPAATTARDAGSGGGELAAGKPLRCGQPVRACALWAAGPPWWSHGLLAGRRPGRAMTSSSLVWIPGCYLRYPPRPVSQRYRPESPYSITNSILYSRPHRHLSPLHSYYSLSCLVVVSLSCHLFLSLFPP